MSNSNPVEVRGVIQAKAARPHSWEPPKVEFTIVTDSSDLLAICYTYSSVSMAQAVWDSLNSGDSVKVFLQWPLHPTRASHDGIGSISLPSRSPTRESFGFTDPPESNAEFTPSTKNALRAALNQAKSEIRE